MSLDIIFKPESLVGYVGDNVTIEFTIKNGYPPYSFKWNTIGSAITVNKFNDDNAEITLTSKGTSELQLTVTDTDNATLVKSITITVIEKPEIVIKPHTAVIGVGEKFTFTANVSGSDSKIDWESSDPTGISTKESSEFAYVKGLKPGNYHIKATVDVIEDVAYIIVKDNVKESASDDLKQLIVNYLDRFIQLMILVLTFIKARIFKG
jgi:hypothetical protein